MRIVSKINARGLSFKKITKILDWSDFLKSWLVKDQMMATKNIIEDQAAISFL